MMTKTTSAALGAMILVLLLATALPAHADEGDPAGWFLRTDPRQRAFLTWTPRPEGPRLIMFGCLRDAGTFTTMSAAVRDGVDMPGARLRLSAGDSVFDVDGKSVLYPYTGRTTFISDLDVDEAVMMAIGTRLIPVLEAGGSMQLEVAPHAGGPAATRVTIPLEGIAELLPPFAAVCFTSTAARQRSKAVRDSAAMRDPNRETVLARIASDAAVASSPSVPTTFRLDAPAWITRLWTYHWNDGRGARPGTISIVSATTGETIGVWPVVATRHMFATAPGTTWPTAGDGPPFLYWTALPAIWLPAGDYEVRDSSPGNWSQNEETGHRGVLVVHGVSER